MDIFEFAIEKEKQSEKLYRRLAEQAARGELKSVFNMLADEERHHCRVVEEMRTATPKDICTTDVLAEAREIFRKMRESAEAFDFDVGLVDVYKQARQFEYQSRDFYLEKARQLGTAAQKDIFLKLAEEEDKHAVLVDNIIELVTRPELWLENPEWFHGEEY